jgi:hypothetical protein
VKRQLLLSLVLGVATSFLIGLTRHLPYTEKRDVVTDALTLPGGLIAGLLYPEGIHTGYGAPKWALLAWTSNVTVYALFWCLCLGITGCLRGGRQKRPDGE